ncbi:MAG: tyrosine--tRNA ligase [Clostridiaceae bacterium]|nr:tyrosine--tRNA ligase [Clostridiaceae bacterium]
MKSVYDTLLERGYIKQLTHEIEIQKLLRKEKVTFYIGFDPTADSLHVGHFIQIMVMAHMQMAGHRPIALIGGGTATIGDPSGKSDMRKMLTREEITHNSNCFKSQMEKLIDFSEDKALIVNNADWLLELNYMDFLTEVGANLSVPRMLTAECFKQRLEKGLSFLEFNYMPMQAYDFLELNRKYECKLQLGGDDQWSNILAGTDLIRKKEAKTTFGMTFTLLTNSEGKKMGKTENGALWLDKEKTSTIDFYNYFRNIQDEDLEKCLSLLTFLPIGQVKRLGALQGREINEGKKILAFEVTKIIHGKDEAHKVRAEVETALAKEGNEKDIPTFYISKDKLNSSLIDILINIKILVSRGEGQRYIDQGSLYINEVKITNIEILITDADFLQGSLIIKRGKKNYTKLILN